MALIGRVAAFVERLRRGASSRSAVRAPFHHYDRVSLAGTGFEESPMFYRTVLGLPLPSRAPDGKSYFWF